MGEPTIIGALGLYLDGPEQRCQTVSPTIFTNRIWAELVLLYLGDLMPAFMLKVPLTTNNIENLMKWNQAENRIPTDSWWGNPSAANANRTNPLNSGQGPPAGNPLGSYADLNQAAYYLAELLLYGPPWANYGAIVAALQSDATPAIFSAAVVQSSFEGTRYGVKAAIDAYNATHPPTPIPATAIAYSSPGVPRGLD